MVLSLRLPSSGGNQLNKGKLRIAVATNESKGLNDEVSEVFGKAKTFTIVDVEDGKVKNVEVIENPAASYKYGAGPIVVKELVDSRVNLVIGPEFGPGASAILEQHGVDKMLVDAGTKVSEILEDALEKFK